MAKLGTERKPVRFRVQTEERLGKIAQICEENGWIFVGGLESGEPEDIREVEYLLNPKAFSSEPRMRRSGHMTIIKDEPEIGRNNPCRCRSYRQMKDRFLREGICLRMSLLPAEGGPVSAGENLLADVALTGRRRTCFCGGESPCGGRRKG